MKSFFFAVCGITLTLTPVFAADTADTIYTGGNIITVNDAAPWGCNSSSVNWFLAGQSKFFG